MALLGLPRALGAIEGLENALYSDDVSLWTEKSGSSGWVQDTLQAAADVVEKCAWAPNAKHTEGRKVFLKDKDIVPGPSVKILGLTIQADNKETTSLRKLKHTSVQILYMLPRVATRQRGMKEADTLKLVQAFII
ncbi:hypothetical protein IscW_ISCW011678 [Ixodes scapularis]|uniref:Uncharacterized protein n=1 Tax=Ixodes scapularis TaxID=6945 RepID=B7Q8C9_IXOSC|nr:hypothetical protein IscW_ISCW011678 [Ixodes scapularis]|eukprot:XP_002412344.1 hypothetical protein IscW_ISCW011678 [Ixodes scapularis]